jgi:hypothetical protein
MKSRTAIKRRILAGAIGSLLATTALAGVTAEPALAHGCTHSSHDATFSDGHTHLYIYVSHVTTFQVHYHNWYLPAHQTSVTSRCS